MAGTKELKELLLLLIKGINGLGLALQDGKISLGDATYFIAALRDLPAGLSGLGEIPAEIKDLDDDEKAELKQLIEQNLDIPQDQIEQYLEAALKLLISAADLLKFFKKDEA